MVPRKREKCKLAEKPGPASLSDREKGRKQRVCSERLPQKKRWQKGSRPTGGEKKWEGRMGRKSGKGGWEEKKGREDGK